MRSRALLSLFSAGIFLFLCALVFASSGPAALQGGDDLSSKLPEGEGKGYVQTLCTSCHGLGPVVSQRKTRDGWEATVSSMLGRISAGMDQETEIISNYLALHFGVESAPAVPAAGMSAPESAIRISHEVLFNFKPGVPEEKQKEVLESGRKMLKSISQAVSVVVGKVAQQESEFRYGLFVGVRSEEDLQAYRNNPEHKKWVEEVFRPVIAKSVVSDIISAE